MSVLVTTKKYTIFNDLFTGDLTLDYHVEMGWRTGGERVSLYKHGEFLGYSIKFTKELANDLPAYNAFINKRQHEISDFANRFDIKLRFEKTSKPHFAGYPIPVFEQKILFKILA